MGGWVGGVWRMGLLDEGGEVWDWGRIEGLGGAGLRGMGKRRMGMRFGILDFWYLE